MPAKDNAPAKAAAPAKGAVKKAAPAKGPSKAAAKGAAKSKASAKGVAKKAGSSKQPAKKAKVEKAGAKKGAKGGAAAKDKKKAPRSKFEKLYAPRVKVNKIGIRRDLTRYVKWPVYIRLQRKKKILLERLKVPPTIHQFNHILRHQNAKVLFQLLHKYKNESPKERRARLFKTAEKVAAGEKPAPRPTQLAIGINAVTRLIERKKAELVVIAHDVDPVELVVWLPALCRKVDVPYVIVKDKSRLGKLSGLKTCSAVALPKVKPEHQGELKVLAEIARKHFNDNPNSRKHWGGGKLGPKSLAQVRKRQKLVAKEQITIAPK